MSPSAAYVTLLTAPAYLPGVLVLNQTLRSVGSKYPLVLMVTPSLPCEARDVIKKRGIAIRDIDHLYPEENVHKLATHDSRFRDTWTKLRYVGRGTSGSTVSSPLFSSQGIRAGRI